MPQLLLVPFGELVVILLFDGQLLNLVLEAPLKPRLVACDVE